jgi:predicted ferric reductase
VLALDTEALWYLTRGTGLVSLLLLTLVMVLGIVQVRQWRPEGWPQFAATVLHRNASLLVIVFLGLHIASAVADGFAPIDWIAAVLPFESPYRSLWLGLGALSFDLLLALIITSLLRRRLSYRAWSTVHWLAYACWPLAFVHGLGTGTDGTTTWVLALDALCLAAVAGATAWRVVGARRTPARRRVLAGSAVAAVVVLTVAWALAGPAQAGWARKAGTPTDLLPANDPPATAGAPDTTTSTVPPTTHRGRATGGTH